MGTTDLDHNEDLDEEPVISEQELAYLLEAVDALFPQHSLSRDDILSTWSGVRPVIGSDEARDPSKERRDHAVWHDKGLVTVSGGKLTTFRLIALDAIKAAGETLGNIEILESDDCIFKAPGITATQLNIADHQWAQRLIGRYGKHAKTLMAEASDAERLPIETTAFCLAECRWAARNESVVHLDDLMLRRTRLGSILEHGGESLFPAIEQICAQELNWDAELWKKGTGALPRDLENTLLPARLIRANQKEQPHEQQ